MITLTITSIPTPLGPMLAGAGGGALSLLEFARPDGEEEQLRTFAHRTGARLRPGHDEVTRRVARELDDYFEGRLREFTIPIAMIGTAFQRRAWAALREIPYGQTRSYGEQAESMGRKRAVRAVGAANGANRIAIVVPCHRVIGADGRLTGYGAGLWRKERLLALETTV